MATFREIQDRITLNYLHRTDLNSEAQKAIVRAVEHYQYKRFWFNHTATAIAVGTESASVALPDDFFSLNYLTVADDGRDKPVPIRSFDRISYRNDASSLSGVPAEAAYHNNALHFTPKPSSATTMTVHYFHTFPTLSADSDSNGWTSAGEDLVVHRATADLLANVVRVTDMSQVEMHKSLEQEAWQSLVDANRKHMGIDIDAGTTGNLQSQDPKLPKQG